MGKSNELNSKATLLNEMVIPLLRWGKPVIGAKNVPLVVFDHGTRWINEVIESRAAINLKAAEFGKLRDFEELAWEVYGDQKKKLSKVFFEKLISNTRVLHNSLNICYPITWNEPEMFVDTIDKVGALVGKVLGIFEHIYSKLESKHHENHDSNIIIPRPAEDDLSVIIAEMGINVIPDENGNFEKTIQASSNGLDFEIKIGKLDEPSIVDPLTCALYSIDFKFSEPHTFNEDLDYEPPDIFDGNKTRNTSFGKITKPRLLKSFHLRDCVKEGTWNEMEEWLQEYTNYNEEGLFSDGLKPTSKLTNKWIVSLILQLFENDKLNQRIFTQCPSYTVIREIVLATFGKHIKEDIFYKYKSQQRGYEQEAFVFPDFESKQKSS
jgi:hypothetical protein